MNVLVVYAHHEPSSLTATLKNTAISILTQQGHSVVESDLYAMSFHPVANRYDFNVTSGGHFNYAYEQKFAAAHETAFSPDIVSEIQKLKTADMILFYAPVWWFSVPAILKGWFDRVLAMGVAWDEQNYYETGLLRGKRAMITAVGAQPAEFYQPLGKHRATMKQIFHPIHHGTLSFCGLDVIEPFFVYGSTVKNPDEINDTLTTHQAVIEALQSSPRYLAKY